MNQSQCCCSRTAGGCCSRHNYTAVWLFQPVAQVRWPNHKAIFHWAWLFQKCQTYGCCSLMTTERADIRADIVF